MNPARTPARRAAGRTYFFLSYAHVPPTQELTPDVPPDDQPDAAPDHWVTLFFDELSNEVRRLARPGRGPEGMGFYDPQLPPGSDWKLLLAEALGGAEVFVPLYSPRYLTWSWPRTEREAFRRRLEASGVHGTRRHVQPVLWTPTPGAETWPGDDRRRALALGEDVPAYAENGLRALRVFPSYRDQYRAVVQRLARQIVDVAEQSPLGPSPVPKLRAYHGGDGGEGVTPFVVAVLAPVADRLPAGRAPTTYATTATEWRPFTAGRTVPVAEYAANLAERLGLPARIVAFDPGDPPFASAPGLLLIDPWVADDDHARAALVNILANLPEWAAPVVVLDEEDTQYARAATLAEVVVGMLPGRETPRVRDARGAKEFEQLVPYLVTETRGRYLTNAKVFPPTGSGTEDLHRGGVPRPRPEGYR
jgi:FxsC-like protein